MSNSVNDTGTDTLFCAETVPSERDCRGTSRDIEWFVQTNCMALPQALLSAASSAWLSLGLAHRSDNQNLTVQKLHRIAMQKFQRELGAWAASKG